MKKRLLAMLLAVVTTITSLPTPVYAAADDAVVDYVDEETDADAVEEYVPDEAEAVEVTDAETEEAVVAEENTEAVTEVAAEEAAKEEAAPAEETASEEAGDADRQLPDVTEQNAVTFNSNRGPYWPAAPSLYGDDNFRFTEGTWDYAPGINNNNVIWINRGASIYDDEWDVKPDEAGKPAYTYKFSLAEGWDKDKLDKLSYTEAKPGTLTTVGGLQVYANDTWLKRAGDAAKITLVKDTDYYLDADEAAWVYDSFKVGRKLNKQMPINVEVKDGITYETMIYSWTGFSLIDGSWTASNVYQDVKLDAEGKEEPVSEFYVYDIQHDTKSDRIDPEVWTYENGKTEERYYDEGVDYVVEEGVVYFFDDEYDKIRLNDTASPEPLDPVGGVNYRENKYRSDLGVFDGKDYTSRIIVYRQAKEVSPGEWVEFGRYYSKERIVRTGVSTNALSVVSVNKAGVYTLKAEISYTVSRNALGNTTDREIVNVNDVAYATIFVNIPDDINAGWAKISYELGGKKEVLNRNDYSKVGGLEAKAAYKVSWALQTSGIPANNKYTADDKGEFKSDKYWAPNNGTGLRLVKVSNAEANGNCDSNGKNLPIAGTGAAYFETPVIIEKTAPGLYGDKEQNNYNAAEKETIKINGIYGDNKFLYMKDSNVAPIADMPAAGDSNSFAAANGIAFRADAAKGTIDVYPQYAGINTLGAYIQYATSNTTDGVVNSGAAITGSNTPVYMIVKEATPQGKVVGIQTEEVIDEDNNTVKDDANNTVYADYLIVSNLEEGIYRLRSTSDNHIIKGALQGSVLGPDGMVMSIASGEYVAVKDIFGRWQDGTPGFANANEINYVLINTFAIKENDVVLEKVYYDWGTNSEIPALSATQTIALSAEEIYVDIVPPMAGHTAVTTDDVEKGVQPSMTDLNYDVDLRFDLGHEGQGRDAFYTVTDVKWNEGPQAGAAFEKDKVYSATVTMTISSNEAISSNVVFNKDIKAENIHVNDGIVIDTDSGDKDLTVPVTGISDVKVNGKTLTFKVTFAKAFIQYEVRRIDVYDRLNGRTVTDLAEPVIYVAPGKEVTIAVYARNRKGERPSLPSISYNGTLNGSKILWEEYFISKQNGSGTLVDEEGGFYYEFVTGDGGETYRVSKYNLETDAWIETITDLTYDEFMANYGSKYKTTQWNPTAAVTDLYALFTISANAAASGEDKITFTAQNGMVISKEIAIRYYAQAEAPKDLTIEYDVKLTFGQGDNAVERFFDVIHGLNPHTWYVIKTTGNRSYNLYSDDKGDIYVEHDSIARWYMDQNNFKPISIQVAYSESSKKAISDPYYLYVKRPLAEQDIYARVRAAEVGNNVSDNVDLYTSYYGNGSRFNVSDNVVWKDKDGTVVANGTPFGAKDSEYTLTFSVRVQKVYFDENGNPMNSYEEGELPYSNLDKAKFFVPGAVAVSTNAAADNVIDITANFKTADAGKVAIGLAFIDSSNYSPEKDENYTRSAAGTDYAVSEGWGEAEGEVYIRNLYFPRNAADPVAVTYTDTEGNVDVSISMNDANGNKTRAMVSANKAGDTFINAEITNADGSKTVLNTELTDISDVYVKLPAPYTANNTDDTNYISGLTADAYYYAYGTFFNDNTNHDDNIDMDGNVYQGVAYANWGPNKNVTGFKRLSEWYDTDSANNRNTVVIKRTMFADDESIYDSVEVTVPLINRINKKGFYVTWPYGATDAPTSYVYTGAKIEPEVWVWYDGVLCNENFYKVKYKNNLNVTSKKKATIQVVGKNGLKGKSNVVEFEITPRNINNATTYSTDGLKNTVTVKKGTKTAKMKINLYDFNQYTKPLKAKKDYKLDSTTAVYNSDGWLLVEGQGNYTGTLLLKVVTVDKLAKLKINMTNKGKVEYNYYKDGIYRVLPAMNVTVGGKNGTKLTEGLDFRIYVEENRKANGDGVHNVGTYKVYVAGNGIYGGKLVKSKFKITPKKLTDVEVNVDEIAAWAAGYQYDNIMGATLERGLTEGTNRAPSLKVVADNVDLGYSYNSKKYVKLADDANGFGYGYRKYTFKGYNNMDNIVTNWGEYYKAVDSVSVTYKNNKKLGTASYTIKFGGNFKGTKAIKGTFKVAETNFNGNTGWIGRAYNGSQRNVRNIIIPDVAYTGKAGTYFSNPLVFYNNGVENENGYTDAKQVLYKKNRDYTVKYYKDATRKDEITNKNKLMLAPGQQYAIVYVKIEGKGGYGAAVDGKNGAILGQYRVYDPKKVVGGCIDLKSMKYYNADAKPVKVKIQYTPSGYIVTSGSGKKLATITNDMFTDGFRFTDNIRSSSKQPNWQVNMYGDLRIGRVVGFKNMKVTVKGTLEKEWFR